MADPFKQILDRIAESRRRYVETDAEYEEGQTEAFREAVIDLLNILSQREA
jgi:hypothetical protein